MSLKVLFYSDIWGQILYYTIWDQVLYVKYLFCYKKRVASL